MYRFLFLCTALALVCATTVSAQELTPPEDPNPSGAGGGQNPPTTVLDPDAMPAPLLNGQDNVGTNVVVDGNDDFTLTNRGRVISDPVSIDGIVIDVQISIPTHQVIDAVYADYIDIVLGSDGGTGVNPNRPWNTTEPGVIIIRILQNHVYVIYIDANGNEVILDDFVINTADGNIPVDVHIEEDEGVLDVVVTNSVNPGETNSTTVVLPPGLNEDGNVVIYNREPVAGVNFVAEIDDLIIIGSN